MVSKFTELRIFVKWEKIFLKLNWLLTLEGIPWMVAAIHRYNHCSLPCRHVSCSVGAVFGPMCYLPGFNVIQRTRGKHEFEKQKWFFRVRAVTHGLPINIQHYICWTTCMSGKLLASALVGHALAVNWSTEILYELFPLTLTK